jgi:predicted secreted protein
MAASSALVAWRDKAKHLRGVRRFQKFYLQLKWFKTWQARAKKLSRQRYDDLLRGRYRESKQRLGMRSAKRALEYWRDKAAQNRVNEQNADEHFHRRQDERVQKIAHNALTSIYVQTAENLENEGIADGHYERQLIRRFAILDTRGPWRGKLHDIQQMEAKADEYREIKTHEVARDGLRTMRAQSRKTVHMEREAEDFYQRHSKRLVQSQLQSWREKTAERQGVPDISIIPALPTTPAARRTALLRTIQ